MAESHECIEDVRAEKQVCLVNLLQAEGAAEKAPAGKAVPEKVSAGIANIRPLLKNAIGIKDIENVRFMTQRRMEQQVRLETLLQEQAAAGKAAADAKKPLGHTIFHDMTEQDDSSTEIEKEYGNDFTIPLCSAVWPRNAMIRQPQLR